MAFVHRTTAFADRATDLIFGLFALATTWMWVQVLLSGQNAGALAEALAWTVLTVCVFGVSATVGYVRNRGE